MNIEEVLTLVTDLKSKGKDLKFVINHLFENKAHYVYGMHVVAEVYKMEINEVERLFFEHEGYKERMDQINPFNQDFIDFVDNDTQ